MSQTQKKISEFLFWFQIFLTLTVFIPTQAIKMTKSVDGLLLTTFLFVDIYVTLNLILAIAADHAKRSRVTVQTVIIYVLGTFLYTLFVAIFLVRSNDWWNNHDVVNGYCALGGVAIASAVAVKKKLSIGHPEIKMYLAIVFRVIPQIMLAANIVKSGTAAGLSGWFVLSFHGLIIPRMIQIALSIREAPWDKNRWCLLITELAGWITWCAVTVTWFIYR